ncbi:diguanylate cyclase [uncultured Neptuniibacter sp.]|uniref:diguanylate cyclase n=1 Tax=uncultured Neptuniibacter sp. TaxID=502143 RepID=UPI00262330DD|nr:diguanylate cyclase [uncultured Neptuniibacter sp.]
MKALVAGLLCLVSTLVFAQENISLQLLWKHQFQFAGYYMAIEKGFYAEEGIGVELKEFDFGIDLVDEVLQGNSQFAVARTSLLIDKNAGADVVALFAAYQKSPLMLLTTKASGISTSSDLKGRNIMITNDAKKVGEVIAMLLQAGITLNDFNQQQHSYNVADLISGKTEAMASYVSNEPFQMAKKGVPYHIIHPKDYGFDMYSDILFTSREFIEKNPELTDRFYRASIRGWQYAFNHIGETAQVIFDKYNSQEKTLDALVFEGQELKKLAFDSEGSFGTLSLEKFNEMAQVYLITGSIFLGYDFSDFIYQPPSNLYRLSQDELKYIRERGRVKVCINPDWYPYESYLRGDHEGMISDYLKLIMGNVHLKYEIVPSTTWSGTLQLVRSGQCELIAGAMQTVKRSHYLKFTKPYLSIPAVVATRTDNEEKPLAAMRVGVIEGSAFHEILQSRYSGLKAIGVNRNIDGLRMVMSGEVDGFIGGDANIAHHLKAHQLSGITLSDTLRDSWDISIAVSQQAPDFLLNILNKSISSIDADQQDNIFKRWVVVNYERKIDYTIIWLILGVAVILMLIGLYRYLSVLSYNRMLKLIAEQDALTGILSRRKMREELESFTNLAQRHNWNMSVIFFDVDDFKRVNDSYGHDAGDRVLISVTNLIKKMSRKTDRFGRWGGEEFLFLMMETDLDQADRIAEKFRQSIAEHKFGLRRSVTCSFGVAQYRRGESVESWISRADAALYLAKAEGKNCVRYE